MMETFFAFVRKMCGRHCRINLQSAVRDHNTLTYRTYSVSSSFSIWHVDTCSSLGFSNDLHRSILSKLEMADNFQPHRGIVRIDYACCNYVVHLRTAFIEWLYVLLATKAYNSSNKKPEFKLKLYSLITLVSNFSKFIYFLNENS